MDNQLEEVRNIWTDAFYSGNYEVLCHYEHDDFKVVYEQDGRVETSYVRYDRIAHAVQNGVWRPQRPEVEFEEYEFNPIRQNAVSWLGLNRISSACRSCGASMARMENHWAEIPESLIFQQVE